MSNLTLTDAARKVAINTLFKKFHVKQVRFYYEGLGDNGGFEGTDVDPLPESDALLADFKTQFDPLVPEDDRYEWLNNAFVGWEINEGSSGAIVVHASGKITIDHGENITVVKRSKHTVLP